tara:strand:+ start:2584 stop:2979 length:396 start_codon:yes stop_codon:yes gene_type:complete
MSVGEKVVATILEQMKIYYFYDIQLHELKGVKNGYLKFDFLIPKDQNDIDLNNLIAIEYNGIFHYHIIKGKTGKYTLVKQQMNDYLKNEYCYENKIPILWIPYWYNIKLIKSVVSTFICNNIILKYENILI